MENNIKEEKRTYSVSLGYASEAAVQGTCEFAEELMPQDFSAEICGDTAISCRLPDGSRAVILSDGMGHGLMAAAESRAAAGLLRRLLKQGVPSHKAIREVNRYLLERNSRKDREDSYATVDLAVIGQTSGRARFYKMGAAPSYVIRGRRIRKIQQSALPAGVLPEIRLTHVSARLAPGDIIVMMSDGICDSGCREPGHEQEDWMPSFLNDLISEKQNKKKSGVSGPRQLANAILKEARHRYGDRETDDSTVVVAIIR